MKISEIIRDISPVLADVVLVGVPFEGTVSGDSGTAKAPEAILRQLQEQVEEFDLLFGRRICTEVNIAAEMLDISRECEPEEMMMNLYYRLKHLFGLGKFPVVLGGEHTVSLGAIKAAKEHFGDLAVIQFDAHSDMRYDTGDYEETARHIAHSTVMRRAHELGCQIIQIGIRSMSEMEHQFLQETGLIKNVIQACYLGSTEDTIYLGSEDIIDMITRHNVWLTVDVDVFSGADFPGTGTFEPGGISWDKFMHIAGLLFRKKNVIGFDVVEVIPREIDTRTEYSAAKLVYNLIGRKFCK